MEMESESKIMALEKEISKLKTENKYLLDKAVKNRKEINVIRPNSKELMSKEPTEENRLLGQGTMRSYLESFRRAKPSSKLISASKIESIRTSANKPSLMEESNHLQNGTSMNIRRMKHTTHHSISNPQGLADELNSKCKSSFTSSFHRLLTTYKRSKETQKSVSYEGGAQSEALLKGYSKPQISYKPKLTSRQASSKEKLLGQRVLRNQKIYSSKRAE